MKTRSNKVLEGVRNLKGRNRFSYYTIIWIRGKWIEEAGIRAGDSVKISVTENQIIISR
jgi:hypothetical protein